MARALNVIDADGHVLEPPDLWLNYLDPKYRDRAPRIVLNKHGKETLQIEPGRILSMPESAGGIGVSGAFGARESKEVYPERYIDARKGGFDPHARIPDMDAEGIDAAFLYPTLGLFIACIEDDPELGAADCRAYNRWLADYCKSYPERLFGNAMLPMVSVEMAIEEMRYAAKELGFRSGFIRPNPYGKRTLHDRSLYPLWEEAQELDFAIAVHGGAASGMATIGEDRFRGFATGHCATHTFEMMAAAMSFLMCGICDKFPRLRVAFLEAGGGWITGWLDRMDRHVDDVGFNDTRLKTRPSDAFRRQCFISFEPTETSLKLLAEHIGPDHILWATDYPHPDGFIDAPGMIRKMGLKPEVLAAIMCDGAKKFYGLN
ncbi:MAG TPA: amidohydrolase family protein [Candidatus Binataceae bacterium]